jgi:hypothetical protein
MKNDNIKSNCNCISKCLKRWVDNYIFLVLNAFHHVQTTFNAILSKYKPNKGFKSSTRPPSESQISSFKLFKNNKVHFKNINLKFQASEKTHFIKSDSQNRTRSGILEGTIYLEMNKTGFLRESGE